MSPPSTTPLVPPLKISGATCISDAVFLSNEKLQSLEECVSYKLIYMINAVLICVLQTL